MIKLFQPTMDVEGILKKLKPVLKSGWLGRGPMVEEFEDKMAAFVGTQYFVATNSCTAALHLALHVQDLPKGTPLTSSPITFIATNAAILYAGYKPVFVDTELTGANPRLDVVTHLAGIPTPIGPWTIIEDCAHALGADLPPQTTTLRCWSFQAVKGLPTGDGGGISTNDAKLTKRLRELRWMGITKDTADRSGKSYSWDYDIKELGWKYAMNDITAAIGLAMLPHVKPHTTRRRDIARRYIDEIHHADYIIYDPKSAYHFVPLLFDNRDSLMAHLADNEIETGVHYRPSYHYAPFKEFTYGKQMTGAEYYWQHELTLPMHASLTDKEVDYIIKKVNEYT